MKNNKFLYNNVYSYDIPSCHYNILKASSYDISHIDPSNKLERNKAIGMMMRGNEKLTKFLRSTTKEIVDFYITNNFLKPSDIILRQYDGFYSTKSLNINLKHNFPVGLEFKNLYDIFIFSINKKMYVGIDCHKDEILIKGIPSRYDAMDKIYHKILNINFLNIKSIVQSLEKYKAYVLDNPKKELFMIPSKDRKFRVFLKSYGDIVMSKKALAMIDVDEIDRYKYFELYLEPFFKSIIYETV